LAGRGERDRAPFVDVNDPRDLDITAAQAPHHTFGGGPHYCLGANLARAEMQEALLRLTALMPT
jgi:cytochrome P450